MSDYVGRLLAKSFGSADVVQSRTPSLFEPMNPSVALSVDDMETNTESVQTTPMPASRRTPRQVATPAQENESTIPAKPSTSPRQRQSEGTQSSPLIPTAPAPRQVIEKMPTTPVNDRNVVTPTVMPQEGRPTVKVRELLVTDSSAKERPTLEPMTHPLPTIPLVSPAASQRDNHKPPLLSGENRQLVVPATQPTRFIPTTAPNEAETTPAAPTIQVTIGRVEIKVNTPALERGNRTNRTSTQTFDEYMRRRTGGGK